jgi:hypothetical protein
MTAHQVFATVAGLPEHAYSRLLSDPKQVVLIKRGVIGYWPCDGMTGEQADHRNSILGVTPAQKAAMEAGSIFGWDTPAADPANYDSDGNPLRDKSRRRPLQRNVKGDK